MNIWVDDQRDPSDYKNIYNIPDDIIWVKTFAEAKELIVANDITWIGFDNDLGSENLGEEGYNLFCLLETKVIGGNNSMFQAVFQTSNSPARAKMILSYCALMNYLKAYSDITSVIESFLIRYPTYRNLILE